MIRLHGEMHRVVGLKVRQSIHTRLHGSTQCLHEFFTQIIARVWGARLHKARSVTVSVHYITPALR